MEQKKKEKFKKAGAKLAKAVKSRELTSFEISVKSSIIVLDALVLKTNDLLNGKTFVITGSLNHYSNRNELKEVIELNGGKVSGSISSKTSYLINNDIDSISSKNKKAKSLGIPIITEDGFEKMLKKGE